MTSILRWTTQLYNILIQLYPREFRLEFEDELRSVFSTLARDAASTGAPGLVIFCLRELRDFPISLLHTHLEKNPMFRFFNSESVRFILRGVLAFVALFVTYYVSFFLIINKMYTNGTIFLTSGYLPNYLEAFLTLFSWLMATMIGGTTFAIIIGEHPRLRWLAVLGIIAALPWSVAYIIFALNAKLGPAMFGMNSLFNPDKLFTSDMAILEPNSTWMKIAAPVLFVLICLILAIMLWREQVRFRWFVIAGMIVWLPHLLTSEVFHLTPSFSNMTEAQKHLQNMLETIALGACMGGMFGLLLKDWRKVTWLILAGAMLYPLMDYVFYQQIFGFYTSLVAPLFPTGNVTTMENLTVEQLALLDGIASTFTGLLFGLPMVLIFVWLKKGKLPALPWMKQQASA